MFAGCLPIDQCEGDGTLSWKAARSIWMVQSTAVTAIMNIRLMRVVSDIRFIPTPSPVRPTCNPFPERCGSA